GDIWLGRANVEVSAGSGGAGNGCTIRWDSFRGTACRIIRRPLQSLQPDSPITLGVKCAGARSAGNPHATCDVAGAGNGATATPKRARRGKPRIQAKEKPTGHRASARPYQGILAESRGELRVRFKDRALGRGDEGPRHRRFTERARLAV